MFSLASMVNFYETFGYIAVFGMLILCGLGVPVPEDISIIAGGVITGLGYGNVHLMLFISLAGVLIGDSTVYWIGRYFGTQIFNKKLGQKLLNNSWYDKIVKSFEKNGKIVLFAARFMPGLRAPIYLTAGITKFTGYSKFIMIDGIAALISVPIWTYLGHYSASNIPLLLEWMKRTKIGLIVVLVALILLYIIGKIFRKKIVEKEIVMETDPE